MRKNRGTKSNNNNKAAGPIANKSKSGAEPSNSKSMSNLAREGLADECTPMTTYPPHEKEGQFGNTHMFFGCPAPSSSSCPSSIRCPPGQHQHQPTAFNFQTPCTSQNTGDIIAVTLLPLVGLVSGARAFPIHTSSRALIIAVVTLALLFIKFFVLANTAVPVHVLIGPAYLVVTQIANADDLGALQFIFVVEQFLVCAPLVVIGLVFGPRALQFISLASVMFGAWLWLRRGLPSPPSLGSPPSAGPPLSKKSETNPSNSAPTNPHTSNQSASVAEAAGQKGVGGGGVVSLNHLFVEIALLLLASAASSYSGWPNNVRYGYYGFLSIPNNQRSLTVSGSIYHVPAVWILPTLYTASMFIVFMLRENQALLGLRVPVVSRAAFYFSRLVRLRHTSDAADIVFTVVHMFFKLVLPFVVAIVCLILDEREALPVAGSVMLIVTAFGCGFLQRYPIINGQGLPLTLTPQRGKSKSHAVDRSQSANSKGNAGSTFRGGPEGGGPVIRNVSTQCFSTTAFICYYVCFFVLIAVGSYYGLSETALLSDVNAACMSILVADVLVRKVSEPPLVITHPLLISAQFVVIMTTVAAYLFRHKRMYNYGLDSLPFCVDSEGSEQLSSSSVSSSSSSSFGGSPLFIGGANRLTHAGSLSAQTGPMALLEQLLTTVLDESFGKCVIWSASVLYATIVLQGLCAMCFVFVRDYMMNLLGENIEVVQSAESPNPLLSSKGGTTRAVESAPPAQSDAHLGVLQQVGSVTGFTSAASSSKSTKPPAFADGMVVEGQEASSSTYALSTSTCTAANGSHTQTAAHLRRDTAAEAEHHICILPSATASTTLTTAEASSQTRSANVEGQKEDKGRGGEQPLISRPTTVAPKPTPTTTTTTTTPAASIKKTKKSSATAGASLKQQAAPTSTHMLMSDQVEVTRVAGGTSVGGGGAQANDASQPLTITKNSSTLSSDQHAQNGGSANAKKTPSAAVGGGGGGGVGTTPAKPKPLRPVCAFSEKDLNAAAVSVNTNTAAVSPKNTKNKNVAQSNSLADPNRPSSVDTSSTLPPTPPPPSCDVKPMLKNNNNNNNNNSNRLPTACFPLTADKDELTVIAPSAAVAGPTPADLTPASSTATPKVTPTSSGAGIIIIKQRKQQTASAPTVPSVPNTSFTNSNAPHSKPKTLSAEPSSSTTISTVLIGGLATPDNSTNEKKRLSLGADSKMASMSSDHLHLLASSITTTQSSPPHSGVDKAEGKRIPSMGTLEQPSLSTTPLPSLPVTNTPAKSSPSTMSTTAAPTATVELPSLEDLVRGVAAKGKGAGGSQIQQQPTSSTPSSRAVSAAAAAPVKGAPYSSGGLTIAQRLSGGVALARRGPMSIDEEDTMFPVLSTLTPSATNSTNTTVTSKSPAAAPATPSKKMPTTVAATNFTTAKTTETRNKPLAQADVVSSTVTRTTATQQHQQQKKIDPFLAAFGARPAPPLRITRTVVAPPAAIGADEDDDTEDEDEDEEGDDFEEEEEQDVEEEEKRGKEKENEEVKPAASSPTVFDKKWDDEFIAHSSSCAKLKPAEAEVGSPTTTVARPLGSSAVESHSSPLIIGSGVPSPTSPLRSSFFSVLHAQRLDVNERAEGLVVGGEVGGGGNGGTLTNVASATSFQPLVGRETSSHAYDYDIASESPITDSFAFGAAVGSGRASTTPFDGPVGTVRGPSTSAARTPPTSPSRLTFPQSPSSAKGKTASFGSSVPKAFAVSSKPSTLLPPPEYENGAYTLPPAYNPLASFGGASGSSPIVGGNARLGGAPLPSNLNPSPSPPPPFNSTLNALAPSYEASSSIQRVDTEEALGHLHRLVTTMAESTLASPRGDANHAHYSPSHLLRAGHSPNIGQSHAHALHMQLGYDSDGESTRLRPQFVYTASCTNTPTHPLGINLNSNGYPSATLYGGVRGSVRAALGSYESNIASPLHEIRRALMGDHAEHEAANDGQDSSFSGGYYVATNGGGWGPNIVAKQEYSLRGLDAAGSFGAPMLGGDHGHSPQRDVTETKHSNSFSTAGLAAENDEDDEQFLSKLALAGMTMANATASPETESNADVSVTKGRRSTPRRSNSVYTGTTTAAPVMDPSAWDFLMRDLGISGGDSAAIVEGAAASTSGDADLGNDRGFFSAPADVFLRVGGADSPRTHFGATPLSVPSNDGDGRNPKEEEGKRITQFFGGGGAAKNKTNNKNNNNNSNTVVYRTDEKGNRRPFVATTGAEGKTTYVPVVYGR